MQQTQKKKPKIKRFSGLRMDVTSSAKGTVATFGGIVSVRSLSECEIEIEAKGGSFLISGERLDLTVLEGSTVRIVGNVERIEIIYRKGIFGVKN